MPFDIDVQAAQAAIDAEVTPSNEQAVTTTPGVAQTPEVTQTQQYERDPQTGQFVPRVADATTTGDVTPEPFWNGDPNALPAEVQPVYKQLQADYTRKTQELAQQRKAFESMGDLGTVAEAVQLYQSLQDPQYWPQLYGELKQGMEQMGLTPQEAASAASAEVQRQVSEQGNTPSDPFGSLGTDPDFAPIKTAYEQMRSELNTMKSAWDADRERERQEQLQSALVGELQRQENFLRQNNPQYTDADIEAVYELSSFHNGNLIAAQQRYESIMADRLQRYLASKQGAVQSHGTPMVANTPVDSAPQFKNLDEAHSALMEHLRNIEANEV